MMQAIRRHYDNVARRAGVAEDDRRVDAARAQPRHRPGLQDPQADPARPRLRPRHPARPRWRRSPSASTAHDARALQEEWERRGIPVPLKMLDSPVPRDHPPDPRLRQDAAPPIPRDVVTVFIPEYVVGHWWEHLLHNQSALRLKGRLLFKPGVMVSSVPVAARLLRRLKERPDGPVAGDVRPRRGLSQTHAAAGPRGRRRGRARRQGRSPTAAGASPAMTAGWSSSAHALPGERVTGPDHRARASASCGPTPSRSWSPPPTAWSRPARSRARAAAAAATGSTSP